MDIAPNFAGQLRIAAADANTTAATMRQALLDAANVIDKDAELIQVQQNWINQLRFRVGVSHALSIVACAIVLISFIAWVW